jgi:hypothetical protein
MKGRKIPFENAGNVPEPTCSFNNHTDTNYIFKLCMYIIGRVLICSIVVSPRTEDCLVVHGKIWKSSAKL